MTHFAVLVLRNQHLDDAQQVTFTRHFGPLLEGANTTKTDAMRLDSAFADVSNVDAHNNVLARDDRRRMFSLGNRLWHTDASFRAVPARYSILSARVVPPHGGNTEFADMRAAYDALDEESRAEVDSLVCEHSLLFSRARLGFTDYTEQEKATMAPVQHPLVRTHPQSGRRSLYLSAHIGSIVGWSQPEALAFLLDLTEAATDRPFVHAHSWQAGDLVIWDNRQTMHRARRFDDTLHVRDMRRTTTSVFEAADLEAITSPTN